MRNDNPSLFEQLLPLYAKGNFDQQLENATPNYSPSQRLLIKMELHRLNTPCKRHIDLRGKVDGICRAYQFNTMTHWLDDVAVNMLRERIKIYQGKFTTGLWEELHNTPNNLKHPHQTLNKKQDSNLVCKATVLKNNIERCEARILLSTAIKVTLPNKEVVHGTSVDISSLGAKIKLPRHFHYAVGEKIILAFPILGSKLKLKQLNQGYTYQVLKIDAHPTQENINLLHVKIDADSASMHTAIS